MNSMQPADVAGTELLAAQGIVLCAPGDLAEPGWMQAETHGVLCHWCNTAVILLVSNLPGLREFVAVCSQEHDVTQDLDGPNRLRAQRAARTARKAAGVQTVPLPVNNELAVSVAARMRSIPAHPSDNKAGVPEDIVALEFELQARLRGCRLLFELDLTEELYDQTRSAVSRLAARIRFDPADVGRRIPAIAAVYLVSHGVFAYDSGNYWGSISVGIDDAELRTLWTSAIRVLDVDRLEGLTSEGAAHRYVAPILVHGGIPRYSLADFFRLIGDGLRHQATSGQDLMWRWKAMPNAFVGIDVPVARFLTRGGTIAVDFLDRCVEMFRSGTSTVGLAAELGLPTYVCSAFDTWRTANGTGAGASSETLRRFPRPVFLFDPWSGRGPLLRLPPVSTAGEWFVGGDRSAAPVRGSTLFEQEVALERAASWRVSYRAEDGQVLLDQRYEGLASLGAVLVDSSSLALLRDPTTISMESVIVVRPADAKVSVVSAAGDAPVLLESYAPLSGSWSGFVASNVSLLGVRSLELSVGGRVSHVTVTPPAARPHLIGDAVAAVHTTAGDPVYAQCPSIALPGGVAAGLFRVSARVNGAVSAAPQPGEGFTSWLQRVVPANGPSNVQLTVRGPLGSDLRTRFTVVPGMAVRAPNGPLFPEDTLRQVTVALPSGYSLFSPALRSTASGAAGSAPRFVAGSPAPVGFERFVLDPPSDAMRLVYSVFGAAHGDAGADLVADLPTVRWSIAARGVAPGTTIVARDVAVDDLAESWLSMNLGGLNPYVRIVLAAKDEELQELPGVRAATDGWLSVSLGAFSDTARLRAGQSLAVELRVGERRLTLARIRQGTASTELSIQIIGIYPSRVTATASQPVAGLVLELCELATPWVAMRRFAMDTGHLSEELDLVPGKWRAMLMADDGWAYEPASAVQILSVGTVHDHELERRRLELSDDPAGYVERALRGGGIESRLNEEALRGAVPYAVDALIDVVSHISGLLPSVFETCGLIASLDLQSTVDELLRRMPRAKLSAEGRVRLSLELCRKIVVRTTQQRVDPATLSALAELLPAVAAAVAVATHVPSGELDVLLGVDPSTDHLAAPKDFAANTRLVVKMTPDALAQFRNALVLVPGLVCSPDELLAATISVLEVASHFPVDRVAETLECEVPALLATSLRTYCPVHDLRIFGRGVWGPFMCYRACAHVLAARHPGDALSIIEPFVKASPRSVETYLARAVSAHRNTNHNINGEATP